MQQKFLLQILLLAHHYAHHQELKIIIRWLLPVVFRAVVFKLLVWCGAVGYVSGLQDAAASCKPDTYNDDARSKSNQICLRVSLKILGAEWLNPPRPGLHLLSTNKLSVKTLKALMQIGLWN